MPCPNHPKGIDQEIKGMVPEKVDDENASPIEGIVVKWDLEADMPQKGAREVRRPCGCSRKCWAMMGCCSVSLLAVVVCTCLFWPRDPEWELVTLDVLSDDAMMFFIMSFAGGLGSLNENTSFPDLHFYAEANISNPNLLGGTAEEGDFQVIFQGYEIGTARSQPISVKPQSHAVVGANSTVRLSYDSFDALTTEVLANQLKLSLQVKGGAWVTGPFGVRIKCRLECDLHCAVDKLFDPTARHEVVRSKTCRYLYF